MKNKIRSKKYIAKIYLYLAINYNWETISKDYVFCYTQVLKKN